jgi:mycofactocin system glycosyltransferase
MKETWHTLAHSRFRQVPGLRVLPRDGTWLVIVPPALRALHLTGQAGAILARCDGARSVRDIAAQLPGVPVAAVAATCARLSWRGLLAGEPPALPAPPPSVAIIIPSWNRAAQLCDCLRSLRELSYPGERLEVIVVDDHSTDGTAAFLEQAAAELRLTALRNERRLGTARSRNRGAAATGADILAFTDSDCLVSPSWLSDLVPYLCLPGVHAAGGTLRATNLCAAIGRYEDVFAACWHGGQVREVAFDSPVDYLPTANLLIRRATFGELGGFADLPYGDDVDLCWRLLALGKRALAVPAGVVAHAYRVTPSGFAATRAAYASAEGILARRHPTRRRWLTLPATPLAFAMLTLGAIAMFWRALDRLLRCHERGKLNHEGHEGHKGGMRGGGQVAADLLTTAAALGLAPLVIVGAVSLRQIRRARRQRAPLAAGEIALATLRGHLSYLYYLCAHVSRYYLWPLALVARLWPPLLPVTLAVFLLPALTDYCRRRPRLALWRFLAIRLLDHAAYGVGVARGAWRYRCWRALLPRIVSKTGI